MNHYKEVSLSEYNNSLDVKLLYPISKYEKVWVGIGIWNNLKSNKIRVGGLTFNLYQGDEDEDKDRLLTVLGEVSRDYLIKLRYEELHGELLTKTADQIHLKVNPIVCSLALNENSP